MKTKTTAVVTLLAAALASPAQAEAPSLDERVAHVEDSMQALLYQLENCLPTQARASGSVVTKRGKQATYVIYLTKKQRDICFGKG